MSNTRNNLEGRKIQRRERQLHKATFFSFQADSTPEERLSILLSVGQEGTQKILNSLRTEDVSTAGDGTVGFSERRKGSDARKDGLSYVYINNFARLYMSVLLCDS
ncbi:hypothetical protein PROFUN_07506 [Planoprotostelium fungivorum]|uniref:Uncharacterized protein n=1 Tax=Planoprotostelium fungivorum TaxID=1890364 RepID=A0A2P6NLP8_9EUKA|nr:hypothetical protein PROFUN_07506 [Planoprotostelium fungivorum]